MCHESSEHSTNESETFAMHLGIWKIENGSMILEREFVIDVNPGEEAGGERDERFSGVDVRDGKWRCAICGGEH